MNATQIATLKKNYAKDLNIDERITKFKEQLENKQVHRIFFLTAQDLKLLG